MNRTNRLRIDWLLFLLWSLFVNVVNIWVIGPLVQDYSILGVVALFAIVVVWLVSIPPRWRKKWITFTLFSVLLGTGIDSLTFFPMGHRITWMVIMSIVMMIAAFWYARIRVLPMVLSCLAIIACNLWLPYEDWTFLSHFKIAYYGKAGLNPMDMPSLPMVVVPTKAGNHVVVTLSSMPETKTDVEMAVNRAGKSANDLHTIIQSFNHRYQLVEVSQNGGKFSMSAAKPSDIARMDPIDLYSSFFPMRIVYWSEEHGNIIQYTGPTDSPLQLTELTNDAANDPANLLALSEQVRNVNQSHWDELLATLGVTPTHDLTVTDGVLEGTWNGHSIHVPVDATAVIATGAFTSPGAHEALLEGANRLQIVDLSTGSGTLVSTYVGSVTSPLSDDIRVGAVDASGQDMIFVNNAPAFILRASKTGPWQQIYTAPPASSLRFEGSVTFGAEKTPEIITDDPSYMRPTPIRFFSSYTYRDGQLYRNWRVYHTNAVNVYPVQFTPGGPTDIVLSLYNQGKFFILSRHFIPVVPITSGLLGLSVIIGFVLRLRKGERRNEAARA